MNGEDISGGVMGVNLSVVYRFSFDTLERAVRAFYGSDATFELQPGEEVGAGFAALAGELPADDETFYHLRVLLTYLHEQLHVRHLSGSPIGLVLYMLIGRQYALMADRLQAFGRRMATREDLVPKMPLSVHHGADEEMKSIRDRQVVFALYHALFMGDLGDMTLGSARDDIVPSLLPELEGLCAQTLGTGDRYPPISGGADDQACSIGALTGEAVLEGLARTNEYLAAVAFGSPLRVLNRYISLKHHGTYAVTNGLVERALGLSPPQSWPVVARLSDWSLQAPVLPFLLSGRPTVGLPELLPAWRFFLLVSRWKQLGLRADDIGDPAVEETLFRDLGWDSPRTIARRILSSPVKAPKSPLTRLYFENLRLAASIRLEQPEVLSFPTFGDEGHRLGPVYSIFSDGMRGGSSGRFARDEDAWQVPFALIDDAVIDALLVDEHLGRALGIARLVTDFLTRGEVAASTLVGRKLRALLGEAPALRLLGGMPRQ